MNLKETTTAVNALPAFSWTVYAAILKGLYAEPGFSDLEAAEVAAAVGATPEAVGGALKKLADVGLATVHDYEVNGEPATFIQAAAHDEGYKAEVEAELAGS